MRKKRKTKKKKQNFFYQVWNIPLHIKVLILLVLFLTGCLLLAGIKYIQSQSSDNKYIEFDSAQIDASRPELDVQLLTVNPYSRSGKKTKRINGIVIHYVGNPGTTAQANRNYFEGLKDSRKTKASSNFVIGLEGEIIQCVPTWEVAYASNNRNIDTVSIECCHPDESGKFTKETYHSMVQLTAWLCMKFDLTENDVIRHYDVTEKICPKYFVENEDAWAKFREDVKAVLNK